MITNNQIILKYTDNPNGSYADIAGIVNKEGNVCGMMPHPERAMESLGTDSGVKLFEAMVNSWREQMSKFIEPSVEEIKLEKLYQDMGLSDKEYDKVCEILGREQFY